MHPPNAAADPAGSARRLLETDQVEWTIPWLEQRILETERLIERIGRDATDDDRAWMKSALQRDLTSKRALLTAMLA